MGTLSDAANDKWGVMKFKNMYLHCDVERWSHAYEIKEIEECIQSIAWDQNSSKQAVYNESFRSCFALRGWKLSPNLFDEMDGNLIAPHLDLNYCFQNPPSRNFQGDFRKGNVFVEVEFRAKALVFHDYFKFLCGAKFNLFDIGVLIVAAEPRRFLPVASKETRNTMLSFDYAYDHLRILPIKVPMLLIGLLHEN